mmetsp:Transcript_21971/g.49485  ORF Transcript_21971/g.49485 Transcript_21971/m.49485 type:complete len:257 (+) Transcript_21971:2302-3072(+)
MAFQNLDARDCPGHSRCPTPSSPDAKATCLCQRLRLTQKTKLPLQRRLHSLEGAVEKQWANKPQGHRVRERLHRAEMSWARQQPVPAPRAQAAPLAWLSERPPPHCVHVLRRPLLTQRYFGRLPFAELLPSQLGLPEWSQQPPHQCQAWGHGHPPQFVRPYHELPTDAPAFSLLPHQLGQPRPTNGRQEGRQQLSSPGPQSARSSLYTSRSALLALEANRSSRGERRRNELFLCGEVASLHEYLSLLQSSVAAFRQ